ncbi:MAG: hypothetical protein PVI35_03200 [Acidimicrobiia bacterium]|jgi:hypothetical protein
MAISLAILLCACASGSEAVTEEPSETVAGSSLPREEPLLPVVSCMAERGFYVEIDPVDGSLGGTFPTDQRDIFRETLSACMSAGGLDMEAERPQLSRSDYEQLYEAHLATAICLESEGFATTPAPSFEVFLQSSGEIWHSYDAVAHDDSLSPAEWQRVNELCPQP